MGLRKEYLDFIETNIDKVFKNKKNLNMLELGNQHIREKYIKEKTGKDYFTNLGYNHISVDLNGEDGALIKDLTDPEDFKEYINYFDIITNSGTTEHVEPHTKQYECFKILYDSLKEGGLLINLNPDAEEIKKEGKWKKHCKTYYTKEFYIFLEKECGFKLLENIVINQLRCSALAKKNNSNFTKDKGKFLSFLYERVK